MITYDNREVKVYVEKGKTEDGLIVSKNLEVYAGNDWIYSGTSVMEALNALDDYLGGENDE